MSRILPYFFEGSVVKGFGRGGKDLGCPTANLDESVVNNLPDGLQLGVYYGLASLDGVVYSMAMSVGRNPQYRNEMKTLEVNLIGYVGPDFYGAKVSGLILGFIREMQSFSSIEELKSAISNDISIAKEKTLDTAKMKAKYFPDFRNCGA